MNNIYNEEIRFIYWNRKRIDLLEKIKKICEMKIKYIEVILENERIKPGR